MRSTLSVFIWIHKYKGNEDREAFPDIATLITGFHSQCSLLPWSHPTVPLQCLSSRCTAIKTKAAYNEPGDTQLP